jgi:D-beta-D-heptose 7-phosphate kinase/D-beta-D-heptose 1-phosphate adenosyltransferase
MYKLQGESVKNSCISESLVRALKISDSKNIVVIGDLMLDEYLIGHVGRISPEAPVPVIREQRREFSFGGATNVAVNCKRVGCNVHMIGIIGNRDWPGEQLISMLSKKNVFIEGLVKSPDRITTRKKRIVAQQQQLLRIDSEQTHKLTRFERDNLMCNIHTVIKPGYLVLISDYAKGMIDRQIIQEIMDRAKVCNSIVVADPKGPYFGKYRGIHYLKPNMKEFLQMLDYFDLNRENSIVDNGREICENLKLRGLIVTMGEKGIQFISPEENIFYPAHKREVYDITGAGDTVLAFLAVGLVNGLEMAECLELGNLAASVAVSHRKTYAVSLDDLLADKKEANEKIYPEWRSLEEVLGWLRTEEKKKIVFTNGCFDLLHSGHIFLLQQAKKRGDVLVVALNTDESVKRYKGDARPIKTLEERAKIISAIDVVDYVVFFDQDTPAKLINRLKPDVLVKGGDYEVEKIAGYDAVISYGGKVEIIEYQEGLSTSNLVKSMKNV